ncbi:ABC transporter ATP-binding protein [Clostridium sp.]|uniref:ABC transporter ATP-binding protein n=1 Tax=Clostridium sp. TaxID=1506 RepID=UPI001A4FA202|nr:ATP-binding cassette domain-containing protein [Clostridium sp.]MBK5241088.1 ATP-binding cassette domain-containing protein [Clostridium sp.]
MIELKNISYKVEGVNTVEIIKNLSFEFTENKIYVITGPNGGGKSSLAKLLMGIYKVSSGEILYNGEDITNLEITERAKLGIGYAFQQPPKFKGMKVSELLKLSAAKGNSTLNPHNILLDVGLCPKDYLNREIDASLSGGELKRIEIASILARKPKFAIFDEPEAGIDLWSFEKLSETFKKLHEETNATIVIISHQERILKLADEVILIANGKIKEVSNTDKILMEIRGNEECDCRKVFKIGEEIVC